LKTTAILTLKLKNDEATRALSSVLAPDNEGLPHGLRLSVVVEGRTMKFEVESDSPSTTVSTILAFMRDVHLFQEVWLLSHRDGARVRGA
jgi:hypothetical protein